MTWLSKTKKISVTKPTEHPLSGASLTGRSAGMSDFTFTPTEFFGAAARCSHLHLIDPALVTPESLMMAAIVERHVDDFNPDFAIEGSANNFKDYVKSFYSGTIATALCYLAMTKAGYSWADHFENVAGKGIKGRTPDFVFASASDGIALAESKGTRSAGKVTFDSTVEAGYVGQVEPHIGKLLGPLTPTHGFCIGSWLTSTRKAELLIYFSKPPALPLTGRARAGALATVQQQNYATAFNLALGRRYGDGLRAGNVIDVPELQRFEWLGREWITRASAPRWRWPLPEFYGYDEPRALGAISPFVDFAIDMQNAEAALKNFGNHEARSSIDMRGAFEPMPLELIDKAREIDDGQAGAIFPDGFAVINRWDRVEPLATISWDHNRRAFL